MYEPIKRGIKTYTLRHHLPVTYYDVYIMTYPFTIIGYDWYWMALVCILF